MSSHSDQRILGDLVLPKLFNPAFRACCFISVMSLFIRDRLDWMFEVPFGLMLGMFLLIDVEIWLKGYFSSSIGRSEEK